MLAADAELDVGARGASALSGDLDEFADAFLIQRHERIGGQNALGGVGAKEGGCVVALEESGSVNLGYNNLLRSSL